MADKWTSGLDRLGARETRQHLAALIDACKFTAVGLEHYQGQGRRDQVAETERAPLRVAKAEIERLSAKLAEYRQPFEPAPPPKIYDAYAAARAQAAAKAAEAAPALQPEPALVPEPVPVAPPRPVLPPRPGMRLPKLAPGRPA